MSYKGPIVEGPRPPRCQKDANPLALYRIASADGVQPLNMTSFLWIQRDQSVAKIVCHPTSRRNVLPQRDRQNYVCHVPKPPRAIQNSISGRGATPEYDLVPTDLEGTKCGKNSLPLDFTDEMFVIAKDDDGR